MAARQASRQPQLTSSEGVHRDIQPPMLQVKAQRHGNFMAQLGLLLRVVVPLQPGICEGMGARKRHRSICVRMDWNVAGGRQGGKAA